MKQSDKSIIMSHFKQRLKQRYNISGYSRKELQKAFHKRLLRPYIQRYNTRLVCQYKDTYKRLYITTFQGKEIKFIYNHKIKLAKTVIL